MKFFKSRLQISSANMPGVAICLCVILLVLSCSKVAAAPMVFAHYLLYVQDTISTYKQEIQLAQSKGIDAFALNTNVWRQQLADNIYEAARQLNSNFKIFFSADVHSDSNGRLSPSDIVAMLSNYRTHPNQLYYQGKSFFTSWLGNDQSYWSYYGYSSYNAAWQDIFNRAGGKNLYFYIPFYATDGSYYGVNGILQGAGSIVDGYFGWDSSAWNYISPNYSIPQVSPGDYDSQRACTDLGKTYMAAVSPWFFKNSGDSQCCDSTQCSASLSRDQHSGCACQVKGNYQGSGLWLQKWAQIITATNPPPLVEIVSWDDWIEGHYTAPGYSAGAASSGVDVAGFPHQAYLELGKHYITWYKTGAEPIETQDSIYLFYYTQSRDVKVSSGQCVILNSDKLTDDVYLAVVLTPGPAATIVLSSGVSSKTFTTTQGVGVFSIPFQTGTQSATYTRGSKTFTLTGAKQISNTNLQSYDFNVYSTFAYISKSDSTREESSFSVRRRDKGSQIATNTQS